MRKIIFFIPFFIFVFNRINAQIYPSLNISLLAHLNPEKDNTGNDGRKYSGCWGWYQSATNREYAIVGTSSQTYFINVTTPANPIIIDSVKAKRSGCTWREIKTYQNYCYIVSDDGPPNSFQIVDMQYLPDSVHVAYDDNTYFERCHTIFIDKTNLYCGNVTPVGSNTENMRVYSLATPTAPILLATLSQNYPAYGTVHDMFVRNDTIYASCGNEGFQIFKFNSDFSFTQLASYTNYIYSGFNHSSWQTDNRKTMVFADEVPASMPAKVIDVSDFNNITLLDTIQSHVLATPHNPYIVGNNWCWMSTYQDGIYLYDISTPSNTTVYGYFDTQPEHGVNDNFSTNAYRGNWGAYPYLPSKIIIACDMQNGIFILKGDSHYQQTVGLKKQAEQPSVFSVYPNPTKNEINVMIANQLNKQITFIITDVLGKLVEEYVLYIDSPLYKNTLNTSHFSEGCYFVTLKGIQLNETKKIIIQN